MKKENLPSKVCPVLVKDLLFGVRNGKLIGIR
jgi:hypothetical protein